MIDEARARELAEADVANREREGAGALRTGLGHPASAHDHVPLGPTRELQSGWFFPWTTAPPSGCIGVIVNKWTGRILRVGPAVRLERDLAMYDRGYQSVLYDLVVLKIHNLEATRRVIGQLPVKIVEPSYEHGQVWRIARDLTDQERWKRLDSLPCVFPGVHLYLCLELLEEARHEGWFEFQALEYRPRPRVYDDA